MKSSTLFSLLSISFTPAISSSYEHGLSSTTPQLRTKENDRRDDIVTFEQKTDRELFEMETIDMEQKPCDEDCGEVDVEVLTDQPTDPPTSEPTDPSTIEPTGPPTLQPTDPPTNQPSDPPTRRPTDTPTRRPTVSPTIVEIISTQPPTNQPTPSPTRPPTQPPSVSL